MDGTEGNGKSIKEGRQPNPSGYSNGRTEHHTTEGLNQDVRFRIFRGCFEY